MRVFRSDLGAAKSRIAHLEQQLEEIRKSAKQTSAEQASEVAALEAELAALKNSAGDDASWLKKNKARKWIVAMGVAGIAIGVAFMLWRLRGDPNAECESGSAKACFEVGRSHELADEKEKAERYYARSCKLGGIVACYNLGVLCLQRNDWRSAEAPFKQSCAKGYVAACTNLGMLLKEKGDLAGALALAREACEKDNALGCNNLASWLLGEKKDRPGAYRAAKKACKLGSALGCVACSHHELLNGNAAEGKKYAYRARKMAPKLLSATYHLGHAYLFNGDGERALKLYREAIEADKLGVPNSTQGEKEIRDKPVLDEILKEIDSLRKSFPGKQGEVDAALERLKK